MVFIWDLKNAEESTERRLDLSEFHTDGTDTEKARDAKLEFNASLKNDELKRTSTAWSDDCWEEYFAGTKATMNDGL